MASMNGTPYLSTAERCCTDFGSAVGNDDASLLTQAEAELAAVESLNTALTQRVQQIMSP